MFPILKLGHIALDTCQCIPKFYRFLVQKVMASCPNNAMTFDEETNKLHYDMFIKLGQNISKLRGDVDA